jgi:hypothetical protein
VVDVVHWLHCFGLFTHFPSGDRGRMEASDRTGRLRSIGETIGDTAERLGEVEAKMATTMTEFAGEATRVMGSAAARTADEVRDGTGDLVDVAADVTARTIEATGRVAGTVLEAGGHFAHELTDAATDLATAGMERAERRRDDDDVPPPTPYFGPS